MLTAQSAGMQRQFPLLPDRIADVQIAQIFLRALLEKADGPLTVAVEEVIAE